MSSEGLQGQIFLTKLNCGILGTFIQAQGNAPFVLTLTKNGKRYIQVTIPDTPSKDRHIVKFPYEFYDYQFP